MIERGIVLDGKTLPGTDWCIRDSDAWWALPGDAADARRRTEPVSLLVGHWTAGHPRTGPTAGPRVVRAMKAREREDGSPMSVSIHFVIGWDGLTWQTADIGLATLHAGGRTTNGRSIGVETCWPGTASQAERLGVSGVEDVRLVRGQRVWCLRPSDELVAAWVRLARFLSSPELERHTEGRIAIARVTATTAPPVSGACEHLHVAGTTKVDAGNYLMDALRRDGWR